MIKRPRFVLGSTYLWAQWIVVIDARFLICIDPNVLELEKSLHGDVHESKGGNRDSVGGCDIRGSCVKPRCNCGIDPIWLAYRETTGVLLLEVVSAVVS